MSLCTISREAWLPTCNELAHCGYLRSIQLVGEQSAPLGPGPRLLVTVGEGGLQVER